MPGNFTSLSAGDPHEAYRFNEAAMQFFMNNDLDRAKRSMQRPDGEAMFSRLDRLTGVCPPRHTSLHRC
ncbi:MAG: hypothetical protein NVS9B15_19470 [Acidobacteriaceae bacterium]